jgi:hypothetical protein
VWNQWHPRFCCKMRTVPLRLDGSSRAAIHSPSRALFHHFKVLPTCGCAKIPAWKGDGHVNTCCGHKCAREIVCVTDGGGLTRVTMLRQPGFACIWIISPLHHGVAARDNCCACQHTGRMQLV